MNVTQEEAYEETGYKLVESVMQGFNGTIFAYGQTWCVDDSPELRGLIPCAFDHLFENNCASVTTEYLVQASYLEIYNKEVQKGVYIKGLSTQVVESVAAIEDVMRKGFAKGAVGLTMMNAESLHSHSIFTIVIESNTPDEQGNFVVHHPNFSIQILVVNRSRNSK
eukprot:GSMAST32.ASY1.ANO1.2597.1 assembled CDS